MKMEMTSTEEWCITSQMGWPGTKIAHGGGGGDVSSWLTPCSCQQTKTATFKSSPRQTTRKERRAQVTKAGAMTSPALAPKSTTTTSTIPRTSYSSHHPHQAILTRHQARPTRWSRRITTPDPAQIGLLYAWESHDRRMRRERTSQSQWTPQKGGRWRSKKRGAAIQEQPVVFARPAAPLSIDLPIREIDWDRPDEPRPTKRATAMSRPGHGSQDAKSIRQVRGCQRGSILS